MFKFLTKARTAWNKYWSEGYNQLLVPTSPGQVSNSDDARTLTPFYAALQFYETAVGSTSIIVYQKKANGGRVRLRERPEYKILHDRPNKAQTRAALFKLLVRDYWIQSECFALIRRDADTNLFDLTRIAPSDVADITYDDSLRKTYWISGESDPVRHEDMIHVVRSPGDDLRGEPMLYYCADVLGLHKQIMDAASYYYQNAARPSMYGYKEGGTADWMKKATETFRESFKKEHQGIANTGSVPFLNVKLEKFPRDTAEDAAIIGALQLSSTAVGQMFNLDPFILGDLSNAHYNSLAAERSARYSRSIRPVFEDFELELNERLFGSESDVYCQFNTWEILRGDPMQQMQIDTGYVQAGISTVAEVRERLDLDYIEGTESLEGGTPPVVVAPTTNLEEAQYAELQSQNNVNAV